MYYGAGVECGGVVSEGFYHMTLDDLRLWIFAPRPSEGYEIECPTCKRWAVHHDWIESEIECEDCGAHAAMECPLCGERYDHVFGPIFNTRAAS